MAPREKNTDKDKLSKRQRALHTVIFEADTRAGKTFDVFLLVFILLSVITVLLESVPEVRRTYGRELYYVEWFFTIVFTLEYLVRLYCVYSPWRYVTSFLGIIDLLSIIPTFLSIFVTGAQSFIVLRIIRLLRIFRIFKLIHFLNEAQVLTRAMTASRIKITVFLVAVFCIVVIMGTLMYLVEGASSGFTSIPTGIYWAIVTVTTVGYGDIAPQTFLGQALASLLMILGYGIIAVPTGIVTTEMVREARKQVTTQTCPACHRQGHDTDAVFCKFCGDKL